MPRASTGQKGRRHMPLVPISPSAALFPLPVSPLDIEQFIGLERAKTCRDAALPAREPPGSRSRADAIEDREIDAGIDEAGDALELGAVLARERQRARDIARIRNLHRICIPNAYEGMRRRTAGGDRAPGADGKQ